MEKNKQTQVVIGVICFILAVAITLQFRTMSAKDSVASKTFVNDSLKDTLLKWEEKYDTAKKELEDTTKQLEEERNNATANDESSKEKTEQIKKNNVLLGLTDVEGPGVIITAKDGQATVATDNISLYLVHDADLREVVNELANAGAEAISINDQRITNSTCITCAGNVILINGEKVTSPFIIKAIGNKDSLAAIDRPGGYIQYMKDYTSVEIKKNDKISIKKYSGALVQNYATDDSDNK